MDNFKDFFANYGGIVIGIITCRYTDKEYKATQEIVKASEGGPALTITQGISTSMKSILPICVTIGLGIYFSATNLWTNISFLPIETLK